MEAKSERVKQVADEEAEAQLQMWEYAFGYTSIAVVKCAVELQIPDILETHGGSITLSNLSTAIGCSPSILHRIMRHLISRGIFKIQSCQESSSSPPTTCYVLTPLSRLLTKKGGNNMVPYMLLQCSPTMVDPLYRLSRQALAGEGSAFKATHGVDFWDYGAANPSHSRLFNDGMATHASMVVSTITQRYPEVFEGVESVVDVGGGDGTKLRMLIKACPWIHGINFDLPHVVSVAPPCDGIEHVAGSMFEMVPKADVGFLMWVLHNWSDEECIQILTKCREAIPESRGKVVILDAVIGGEDKDKYGDVHLVLDMVMLAHTEKGRERTMKEWEHVIKAAGFRKFNVTDIQTIVSVIEAYP